MKSLFNFHEAVYNQILSGMTIYYSEDGDPANEVPYVIDYVKVDKKLRSVKVFTVTGEGFVCAEDSRFNFEVSQEKENGSVNKKPNKGQY